MRELYLGLLLNRLDPCHCNNYAPKGASNYFKGKTPFMLYGLLKVGTPLLILIICRSAELSSPNMSIQGTKRIKTLSK